MNQWEPELDSDKERLILAIAIGKRFKQRIKRLAKDAGTTQVHLKIEEMQILVAMSADDILQVVDECAGDAAEALDVFFEVQEDLSQL
jgi:DNA-binding XRE family transcriptional regulator